MDDVGTVYGNIVRQAAECSKDYADACELASQVTKGKFYVVGSFVYKSIINAIYGGGVVINDIDLLVESLLPEVCSAGWTRSGTKFTKNGTRTHNCTRTRCRSDYDGTIHDHSNDVVFPGRSADMMPLQSICNKAQRGPSLENYLDTVPFTIQSIAYDPERHHVLGDVGINAIRSKTVGIQDIAAAKRYTNLPKHDTSLRHPAGHPLDAPERVTVKDLLERKARELDFILRNDRCLCDPCILHEQVSSTVSNMLK